MKRQKTRERGRRRPLLLLLILTALLALSILLFFNWERLADGVLNQSGYRDLMSAAQAEQIQFRDSATNRAVTLGDGLAVASLGGLTVYDRAGSVVYTAIFSMERPVIERQGDFVLAYDLGGRAIHVRNARETLLQLDWEEPLIDVSINENGWLAVSHEQSGTRGVVVVLTPQGESAYRVFSDVGHVMGASLASDNRTLAILTATEDGGRILWYSTAEDEPQASFLYEGELFFDLWFTGRQILAVISSNILLFLSDTGEIQSEYRFFDRYLRAFDRAGDSAALYLSPHQTGIGGELVLLGGRGAIQEIEIQGAPLDISLSGRYVATLFVDRLALYRNGREHAQFGETEGRSRVLMRADGSVFLLSAQSAKLLVP